MNAIPPFDAALLRRYDTAGPRYTSYPTAPQFHSAFGEAELREVISVSNGDLIPRRLSLYAHIPFCASPCFYCGCNRIITRDSARGAVYLERLLREMALVGRLFDRDREVVQLHLGGGTPNYLDSAQLGELMEGFNHHFRLAHADTADISIELDPRFVDAEGIAALAFMGFNRASLGVQDFDPAVQERVNRVQSVDQTLAVVAACRQNGFRSVNIDLIYGLPGQNIAGFGRTLDIVLDVRPDRLAIYSYAHMPTMFRAQKQIDEALLPDADAKLDLLRLAIEKLTAAGYRYIGMDHFALPTDELSIAQEQGSLQRNFMGYTTHAQTDLVGLGVSAISHIGDSFSQNPRDLPSWDRAIDAGKMPIWRGLELRADDLLRADLIQQLMCEGTIDISGLERRHEIRFSDYFAEDLARLQPLIADGLVTCGPEAITATARGRLLLRIIAACFDHYLHQSSATIGRYSRSI